MKRGLLYFGHINGYVKKNLRGGSIDEKGEERRGEKWKKKQQVVP